MKTKRTALALQGGAALGAYEYGVLKALYEQPNFSLDIITGVSIGAFQAAVLAGAKDDPIGTLDMMWRDRFTISDPPLVPQFIKQYLSILGNQHMYRVRPDFVLAPLFATSIYDSAPLHRTLSELIDLDRLNSSPIHVVRIMVAWRSRITARLVILGMAAGLVAAIGSVPVTTALLFIKRDLEQAVGYHFLIDVVRFLAALAHV